MTGKGRLQDEITQSNSLFPIPPASRATDDRDESTNR